MDLTLDIKEYRLNIRAAGIIIHHNKVLLHKHEKEAYYALIGGRVKIGESSAETVKRELQEELGKNVKVAECIATIENFFEENERKYHEILFVYNAEFLEEEDQKIEEMLLNAEGNKELQYVWIDIEKIEEYHILPQCIKNVLKEKTFPIHQINKD